MDNDLKHSKQMYIELFERLPQTHSSILIAAGGESSHERGRYYDKSVCLFRNPEGIYLNASCVHWLSDDPMYDGSYSWNLEEVGRQEALELYNALYHKYIDSNEAFSDVDEQEKDKADDYKRIHISFFEQRIGTSLFDYGELNKEYRLVDPAPEIVSLIGEEAMRILKMVVDGYMNGRLITPIKSFNEMDAMRNLFARSLILKNRFVMVQDDATWSSDMAPDAAQDCVVKTRLYDEETDPRWGIVLNNKIKNKMYSEKFEEQLLKAIEMSIIHFEWELQVGERMTPASEYMFENVEKKMEKPEGR